MAASIRRDPCAAFFDVSLSPNGYGDTEVKDLLHWADAVAQPFWLGPPLDSQCHALAKRLFLFMGDLTRLRGSSLAIVNAARSNLTPGGGVNGAIHRAAGPELEISCRLALGEELLPVGSCVLTNGFKLPCGRVLHAVTPSHSNNAELELTYRNILEVADATDDVDVIAIPALATGSHFFDPADAARIAVCTSTHFLRDNTRMHVVLCAFDIDSLNHYKVALTQKLHSDVARESEPVT
eukprot:TRINITY_DN16271_c1_g1_i1.p1 TRINITY_DN16271_c1_g1~~TRINITY_DN16271_c1_g1_i1.p1  ORF type:complete len:238 (-),score=19.06 TRINITY_DN16271_c1_g1_i1:28-741(-)